MCRVKPLAVRALVTISIALVAFLCLGPVGLAQRYDTSLYSGLHWRMIGPFRAGRVNAVAGVMGQPETFYFGSVGGGVWKTTNAGRTWVPIFDSASSERHEETIFLCAETILDFDAELRKRHKGIAAQRVGAFGQGFIDVLANLCIGDVGENDIIAATSQRALQIRVSRHRMNCVAGFSKSRF